MACKCTQTTSNATGGGSITSALSACTYPLWIRHLSGCTSDLDVHFGNPGANFLFNIGQANQDRSYGVDNIGINKTDPMHTFSMSGTIDVQDYMHFEDSGYGPKVNPALGNSVYLGYGAGSTRTNNANSSRNVAVGAYSIGSVGVMDNAQNNVAVGFTTGPQLTSGNDNVMIGGWSGPSLNSGSRNTFLGNYTASEITTQTGNVYLGYGQGAVASESNTLRIGNQLQDVAGTTRPLIQGDFAESGATIWGNLRILDTPPQLDIAFLGVDKEGYVKETKAALGPTLEVVKVGPMNTGIWTANTVDCGGGYMGDLGYRSVSISGGTNPNNTLEEYFSTRVGIGTESPTVPLHIKGKYSYSYVQSIGGGASYIASVTDQSIGYIGVAGGSGVQSGSTTWRMKGYTSDIWLKDWNKGSSVQVGTGYSIMRASRSVASDSATQKVVNPFNIVGDSENLDGAIVVRGDTNIGLGGRNHGVGIFTPSPNAELTVVGAMSATGAIHSTDYIKFPNGTNVHSTYIGYQAGSGTTTDRLNVGVGYQALTALNGSGALGNTAIGNGALALLTSGDYNDALGQGAMAGMVSGSNNTAMGGNSMSSNQTGSGNVSIGGNSLVNGGNESNNIAIGYDALANAEFGSNNIAIGTGSGNGITNQGHFNIGIGNDTGNLMSGRGLVALGHGSMTGASASNDVICLGYNAQPPSSADFTMNIGDVIYGGQGSVSGDRKAVGINYPIPLTALDVKYQNITSLGNNRGGGNHIVTFGDAGTGYVANSLVQLRGADNWVLADADHTTNQGNLIGISMGDEPEAGILLKGYYNVGVAGGIFTWLNGGPLYVSTVAGKVTDSLGLHGVGDYIRLIGNMTDTSHGGEEAGNVGGVIYFNPDNTWVTL